MPRNYKRKLQGRKYGYDITSMNDAIEAVRQQKLSVKKASETFNVNRSTLIYKLNGEHGGKIGGRTALSQDEEQIFVHILKKTADWGFGLSNTEFQNIVHIHLKTTQKDNPFTNNKPSLDWVASFLKRHQTELSSRSAQSLPANRAYACNPKVINDFFTKLESIISRYSLLHKPANIFNCDETGFQTDVGSQKIICRRGMKNPHKTVATTNKALYTVMECCSADGLFLPPYVVYKGIHLYEDWCLNGPHNASYTTTPSGWMEAPQFLSWFRQVFIPETASITGTKLLILDGHGSHLSLEFISLAKENNIELLCLPAHTSSLLQPLDVGVYKPAKTAWRKILGEFYVTERCQNVDKKRFPYLLKKLHESGCFSRSNAIAAFDKCGIYPLNRCRISSEQLSTSFPFTTQATSETNTEQPILSPLKEVQPNETISPRTSIEKALLDHFKEKIPKNEGEKRKRVKRTLAECLTADDVIQRLQKEKEEKEEIEAVKRRKREQKEAKKTNDKRKKKQKKKVESSESESEGENIVYNDDTESEDNDEGDDCLDLTEMDMVIAVYENHWYIAQIKSTSLRDHVPASYMERHGYNRFLWPEKEDVLMTNRFDILCCINQEDIVPVTSRFYGLDVNMVDKIENKFQMWKDNN